ncbi:hypothetical protein E4T50_11890 [Aureobasidium sp. EXF-12298]|nr:hypothetical protein E4T50_11890 [Aureobasidium sp. EXF-12298]KAI4766988.1 hypothetical protein E4T51_00060 [Aureobasidium sp. EXF-12344]KAI4770142.1 hypothetical protein E4T52_14834 [Aureobasidium sp. EXF-3400]
MPTDSTASTMSYEDSLSSQYLTSSISSLSSARAQSSQIARTYRQAAQLFLTRRLYEALSTIDPIISPEAPESPFQQNDHTDHHAAPVAFASKTSRVKVWSFYLTLLNAIIDLGPEEGKLIFGSTKWRELASYARQGTIWELVVKQGYQGNEGAVDAEVVVNLATLLLAHMPSQQLNQQRLETYLSALSNPSFDIAAHLEASQQSMRNSSHHNGTSTPRDLNTRLKLLELYTLHVLPQNDEWDYARDFISMSEVLDDERRDAFLQALHTLKEEKALDGIREKELQRRQDEEMQQRRLEDERRRREEARAEQERRRREVDERPRTAGSQNRTPSTSSNNNARAGQTNRNPPPTSKAKPPQKKVTPPAPRVYRSIFATMQAAILNARKSTFLHGDFIFTLALVAAGGAAFGAATTAALFPRKTASPVSVNTPAAPFPTPATNVPLAVGKPAGVQEALAAVARPVDPNGLYQYGFPGPVSDLRAAASLTSAYDRRTRNPAWVVEHITPESLKNSNADRKHSVFVEDEGIPEKFRAKLKDYFRSGYDRGHQVPAADAKWSQQAMDDTFALSNMCPQVGEGFNRDYWAHFEDFCRRLTGRYPSVRIVTGPLYLPKKDADGKWRVSYEVIGNPPNVAVPTHFYKVIFAEDGKIGGQVSLGAFVLPNARIANDKPLQDFEVPLEAVERASGLEFASLLPPAQRKSLCKEIKCSIIVKDYSQRQKTLANPPPPPKANL